jgi:hypothetical protein
MQFVRRTFLVLCGLALPALLFATAIDFGIYHVAGTAAPVKKILSDSGIYGSVVSQALNQAKTTSNGSSQVSLLDLEIKNAAEGSFSPQVVQSSSEKVIDGVYDWLGGKTPQPVFNVDLSGPKNDFADKVGQLAKDRAAKLPVCTSAPTNIDPLSATCLPPGITPAQVGVQAKNDVLAGQGFLEHPTITAENFKGATNQSIFDKPKSKQAPKRYQLAVKLPFILAALALLTMLAIIFLSNSRRKGIRRAAIILSISGLFMLLFAWGFNRIMTHNVIPDTIPKVALDNKVLQSNVQIVATEVVQRIHQNYLIFGIGYLALGILGLLVAMLMGKGGGKKVPAPAKTTTSKQMPAPAPRQAQRPASPRPKSPPKIQG